MVGRIPTREYAGWEGNGMVVVGGLMGGLGWDDGRVGLGWVDEIDKGEMM